MSRKAPKREKSAMSVSLYGNLFFVIVELCMAIFTGSQAVLLDAAYDGIEFLMLLPSIFMIPLLYQPETDERPYGYLQLESLFLIIKGFAMSAVTVGLIFNNIQFIIHGGRPVAFETVAYFELFACVLGVLVYLYLRRKNQNLNSPLITTEMVGWKIDSVLSLGMTTAFFLPQWIHAEGFQPLVPYLDPIITVVLSLIMLPEPIGTVITAFRDLMLIPPEEETVEEIKSTVEPLIQDCGYCELHYNIVRTGRKLWISVYMTLQKDEISLRKLTEIQDRCGAALEAKYPAVDFELLPVLQMKEQAVRSPSR